MLLRSLRRAANTARTMRRLESCASTGAAHLSLPGELDALAGVLASLATPPDVVALNAKVEAAAAQTPPLDAINDPVGAREARAAIYEHEPRRIDDSIPGLQASDPPVGISVFEPPAGTAVSGLYLQFHGGGWVVGSAYGQSDGRLQRMADDLSAVVVSVEYRLAPESQYPAPVDDAVAALNWAVRVGAEKYGAPALVAGGESSGAHLLLAGLLRCSADVRRRYVALNLVYGYTDLVGTPSRLAFGRRLVFCNSELDWFARLFCPDPAMRADASPLRADLPDDLPPALFSVGTCDALLDDTLELARRWPAPSDLVVYPGAAHGVGHFGPHEHTAQGEDLLRRVDAYVGAAFGARS